MSQLENHPEGFNAMRRMFEEVQEPLMEAANASNATASNANTSSSSSSSSSSSNQPLPNPWGGRPSSSSSSSNAPNPAASAGLPADLFSGLGQGGMGGLNMSPAQMAALMRDPNIARMTSQMFSDPSFLEQV